VSDLAIGRETVGDVVVVTPVGRIDSATAKTLEQTLLDALGAGSGRLVIDFAGVDYISSAGLRVILLAGKKARAGGGELVLAALKPTIKDVFEISGFLRLFEVKETREEAVAAA
jgi:anti-anti-sigma factor